MELRRLHTYIYIFCVVFFLNIFLTHIYNIRYFNQILKVAHCLEFFYVVLYNSMIMFLVTISI